MTAEQQAQFEVAMVRQERQMVKRATRTWRISVEAGVDMHGDVFYGRRMYAPDKRTAENAARRMARIAQDIAHGEPDGIDASDWKVECVQVHLCFGQGVVS